jgi:hypothetical protein
MGKMLFKRHPRFSVWTLLLLVTIVTFAAWVYWDGLKRWQWHRDQQDLLLQLSDLKQVNQCRDGVRNWRAGVRHG